MPTEMSMKNSFKILNWVIGGYIAIGFFYSAIVYTTPSLRIIFIVTPITLLLWQALIVRARLQEHSEEPASIPYELLEDGDGWRVFGILLIGHIPIASHYIWGFWLFSGIVVILLIILTSTASVEFYRRRSATLLVIGCIAFACTLLIWERNMYVVHYGVPIIGHFFEKPEYDAKYQVDIQSENSNVKHKAIADIHVGGRTETEEAGEEVRPDEIRHSYVPRGLG